MLEFKFFSLGYILKVKKVLKHLKHTVKVTYV